jgi:hypothetical protein
LQIVAPDGTDLLGGYQNLPYFDLGAFNHLLLISRSLSPAFTQQSGRYVLNWRATDEFGNASTGTVSWTMTLRAPPIRHRLDFTCPTSGPNCASTYALNSGSNTAYKVMTDGGLPNNEVWAAGGVIDNPTEVPVRIRLSSRGFITYKRNLKIDYPTLNDSPPQMWDGCNPDGAGVPARLAVAPYACYSIPNTAVQVGSSQTTNSSAIKGVRLFNGSVSTQISPCAGCAANEFELPPHAEGLVVSTAFPYSFLFDAASAVDVGTLHVTGKVVVDWLRCISTSTRSGQLECAHQVVARTISYLTHIEVSPSVQMTVLSAPGGSALFAAPVGDGVFSGLVYTGFNWVSSETGF